jgi:hypothetical protein
MPVSRASAGDLSPVNVVWCFAVSGCGMQAWSQGLVLPYPLCPAGMAGVDAPPFTRYARAGTVGYSMITGCSPRYSRVTARDHDFGLPGHPRRVWGRERGNNRGNTDHATHVSAKHQRHYSDRNRGQIPGRPGRLSRMAGYVAAAGKGQFPVFGQKGYARGLVRRIRQQHRGEHTKSLVMDKSPGRARRESGKPNGRSTIRQPFNTLIRR